MNSRKMKIGMWIVLLNVVAYTAIEINGAYDHLTHEDWDPHANFHAVSGLLWLLTLFVVNSVLLLRYVKRGDTCAWWLVTFIGVGVFGGAVAADPLTIHGLREGHTALATGEIAYWSGWFALVTWTLAMLLIRPGIIAGNALHITSPGSTTSPNL